MAYFTENETQSLTSNSRDNQAYLNSLTEEIQKHVDDLIQREFEILKSQEVQNGDNSTISLISSLSPVPSETPADVPTSGNNSSHSADLDSHKPFDNCSSYTEFLNEEPTNLTECQLIDDKQNFQPYVNNQIGQSTDDEVYVETQQSCSKEKDYSGFSNNYKSSVAIFENKLADSDESDQECQSEQRHIYPKYQSRLPPCYQESIMVTPSHSSCNSPRFNDPIRDHLIVPEPIPFVNWLLPAIMACVCCFCPIGIFAVINAVKANKAADQGYMDIAAVKAIKAKKLITLSIIVGFTTGFVIGIIFILYHVG